MKLLYCGELWEGSTALQRAQAFARQSGVQVSVLDVVSGERDREPTWYERARWKIGWPVDAVNCNARLLKMVEKTRPDVVFVDNVKVISQSTVRQLKSLGAMPVYFSPDDIIAPHNMKRTLRQTISDWAIMFTTKRVNVDELRDLGASRTVLVGNAYDAQIHKPLQFIEHDCYFEAFDAVFIGAFEQERCRQINLLAKAGVRVAVYGAYSGIIATAWRRSLHHSVVLRSAAFGKDYQMCLHHGKVALGFLRKINRDVITTRSIEIPAMARPMVAEKTDAHDEHFVDGLEYAGFSTDKGLVSSVCELLEDDSRRLEIGQAGRRRCLMSGYSSDHRAQEMLTAMREVLFLHSSAIAE